MALQLGGLVSGFDTESLISSIISHYSKPLDIMQSKKDRLETAQNAWKDVNTRLSNLRNTVQSLKNSATFTSRVTASSDEKVLTASAGTSSTTGTYQLMIKQMASYHRYATASAATITGNESADANTALSLSGSFTIRASDSTNTASITVASSDTLRNISSKINEANAGLTASIVEGRLVIKSDTMGDKGKILIDGQSEFDSSNTNNEVLEKLALGQTTAAQDAEIEYDGITFTRGSNSISDIITNVTLNITGTSDSYVYLTVSADTSKAAEAITAFVDQYNSLMSFIEETTYVAALSTLTTRSKNDDLDYSPYDSSRNRGTLQGDTTIMRLESQLRQMVSRSVSGFSPLLNSLSALGVTTSYYSDGEKQSGYLTINESKLYAALADPVSSAAVTGRNSLPVQYSSYNSLSAATITGKETDTAGTALGLSGWFAVRNTGGDTPVKLAEIKIEATDSLTTIKNKINNEGAGVTASINSDNQLVITSNTMGIPGQLQLVKIVDDGSIGNNATAIQTNDANIVTAVGNMGGIESVTVAVGTTVNDLTNAIGPHPSSGSSSQNYEVQGSDGTIKTSGGLTNGDVLVVTSGGVTTKYTIRTTAEKDAFDSLAFSQRSTVSKENYALQAGQSGTIVLEINGSNYTVQLKGELDADGKSGPMTTQEVLNQINRVIGTVATASLDSTNKLVITSRSSGVNSTVKIKEIREEHSGDLAQLGLVQGTSSRGKDLDAFFTGETAPTQGTITSLQPLEIMNTQPGTLVLLIDNKEVTINFNTVYNHRDDLVKYLNDSLEGVGQAYLDANNYLVIRSLNTGESSSVRVMRVDKGLAALNLEVGQYGVGEDEINGLAILLDNFYESWVKSGGILSQKSSYLTSQMNDIQKQMDALTARIDMRVEYLWKQFSNMESKLSELSTQSQWLDLQLANLTSSSSSK